jgi:hypothetical protein
MKDEIKRHSNEEDHGFRIGSGSSNDVTPGL